MTHKRYEGKPRTEVEEEHDASHFSHKLSHNRIHVFLNKLKQTYRIPKNPEKARRSGE